MTVAGTFDSGHYEYDSALVMLHYEDAQRLFRLEGPTGVRLKLKDLHQAPRVAQELAGTLTRAPADLRDWTQQNNTWFAAVQLEKRMMFIILTLIVAVAAFNLVSTLVMTRDRQARRHRHLAHAGRIAALHHGHLHGAGRHGRA